MSCSSNQTCPGMQPVMGPGPVTRPDVCPDIMGSGPQVLPSSMGQKPMCSDGMCQRSRMSQDGMGNMPMVSPDLMGSGPQFLPGTMGQRPACSNKRMDDCSQFVVGMAYVPWQHWQQTYPICKGFRRGTIFPDLDKPFLMGRCR